MKQKQEYYNHYHKQEPTLKRLVQELKMLYKKLEFQKYLMDIVLIFQQTMQKYIQLVQLLEVQMFQAILILIT